MITAREFADFCRQVRHRASGEDTVMAALGAAGLLRGKIVVIPGNVEIGRGAMGDSRGAIEEVRRLKAQAEDEIAACVAACLRGLELRTGICAQGVRVDFSETTGIGDDHPRYVVSGVKIDLGRI